jgi:hypothetical protein
MYIVESIKNTSDIITPGHLSESHHIHNRGGDKIGHEHKSDTMHTFYIPRISEILYSPTRSYRIMATIGRYTRALHILQSI